MYSAAEANPIQCHSVDSVVRLPKYMQHQAHKRIVHLEGKNNMSKLEEIIRAFLSGADPKKDREDPKEGLGNILFLIAKWWR